MNWSGRRRGQRGAVTAELAMTLPLLVAVTIGLVWLLSVGAAQLRTVDAAREAARVAARGDGDAAAVAAADRVAVSGSRVSLAHEGGAIRASVSGEVGGPGGLFAFLPAVTVHATAIGVTEEGVGGVP